MNDFLRNFIMKTITEMIEKNVAEWQVRQYALGWYSKSLITEEDLATIEQKYAEKEVAESTETKETTEVPDTNVGSIEETTENVETVESEADNGIN